jgi:hypothetical protein
MKKNYDLRFNPPQPSSEEIKQRKDFNALLQQYQEREAAPAGKAAGQPFRRVQRPWWLSYGIGSAAVVAIAIGLVFFMPNEQEQALARGSHTLAWQPVQAQWAIPNLAQSLPAEQGGTISAPSGSTVKIPAQAFQNKAGKPVKGMVDIEYREVNDPAQLIAQKSLVRQSEQLLQSVGMIYVAAYQNGEELFLAEGKRLEVSLQVQVAQETQLQDLMAYHLQGVKGWQAQGSIQTEILAQHQDQGQWQALQYQGKGQLLTLGQASNNSPTKPQAPIAPQSANKKGQILAIDFNKEDFPELKAYQEVVWQTQDPVKPEWAQTVWDDAKIKKIGQDYALVFTLNGKSIELKVQPVLPQANAKAQERYQQELAAYEKALAQWQSAQSKFQPLAHFETKTVTHRFEANQLGLWNCGRVLNPSQLPQENIVFVNSQGQSLKPQQVFILYPQQQQIYWKNLYSEKDQAQIALQTERPLQAWILADNGQLLRCTGSKGQQWIFEPTALPQDPNHLSKTLKGLASLNPPNQVPKPG